MRYDSVIIGGGPAGLAAAIRLSRRGERVLLVEQKTLPQKKCCGEFLHPTAIRELTLLLDQPIRIRPIRAVRISAGKISREFRLAHPAGAIERERLSERLLQEVSKTSAEIWTGSRARLDPSAAKIRVRIRSDAVESDKLILAAGSAAKSAITRAFARRAKVFFYGFSLRCPTPFPGKVALAALSGGYAGICDLGNSTSNLAGLVSTQAYSRLAPQREGFGSRLVGEIPAWEGLIPRNVKAALYQVPVLADPVNCRSTPDRVFSVGDAAGMRETAFGDGIARSLRQARFLEESLQKSADNPGAAGAIYSQSLQSDPHHPNRILLQFAAKGLRSPRIAGLLLWTSSAWIRRIADAATRPAQDVTDLTAARL